MSHDIPKILKPTKSAVSFKEGQPFLRWAGSKRKLLPVLLEAVPPRFDRYVEPFAGSACLFFALNPSSAILADINGELINAYRELKTNADVLARCLSRLVCNEKEYYRIRKWRTASLNPTMRAARLIYLNRFCFNGLYRTNKSGEFNVPYGGERSGKLPTKTMLRACAESLQKAKLLSKPFDQTLNMVKEGDFVYLDPPYSIGSRRVFNEYSNFVFGPNEIKDLKQHLIRLDKNAIPFLVSYGFSREGLDLARGFRSREVRVQRRIAAASPKRKTNRELLITNY
jgi:DNA adenine methylase